MDILVPHEFISLASNVPDTTNGEWAAGTTYSLGQVVKVSAGWPSFTHEYESLVAANLGNDPLASTGKWLDLGPTNRMAMFDDRGGTVTTMAGNAVGAWDAGVTYGLDEVATVSLTVDGVVWQQIYQSISASNLGNSPPASPSQWLLICATTESGVGAYIATRFLSYDVDAVAFFGLQASFAVARSNDMDGWLLSGRQDMVLNVRTGTFAPSPEFSQTVRGLILTYGTGSSISVKCGSMFACRRLASIGTARYGIDTGIIDFSKKITDDFGYTTLVKGAWSKQATLELLVPTASVNEVFRVLTSVRGQAVVWHEPAQDLEPLLIYGFIREFRLAISAPNQCVFRLQIEGMT